VKDPGSNNEPGAPGMAEMALVETDEATGEEVDVFNTAKKQTKWNRWAAFATAISMFCQAVSLML
jgi:hypothetical protein